MDSALMLQCEIETSDWVLIADGAEGANFRFSDAASQRKVDRVLNVSQVRDLATLCGRILHGAGKEAVLDLSDIFRVSYGTDDQDRAAISLLAITEIRNIWVYLNHRDTWDLLGWLTEWLAENETVRSPDNQILTSSGE
jgi:hypothetical protein